MTEDEAEKTLEIRREMDVAFAAVTAQQEEREREWAAGELDRAREQVAKLQARIAELETEEGT